jgi:hypothetical protein
MRSGKFRFARKKNSESFEGLKEGELSACTQTGAKLMMRQQ